MSSSTPKTQSFRNAFLIATPDMGDPRFQFAVIYVVSHMSLSHRGGQA